MALVYTKGRDWNKQVEIGFPPLAAVKDLANLKCSPVLKSIPRICFLCSFNLLFNSTALPTEHSSAKSDKGTLDSTFICKMFAPPSSCIHSSSCGTDTRKPDLLKNAFEGKVDSNVINKEKKIQNSTCLFILRTFVSTHALPLSYTLLP